MMPRHSASVPHGDGLERRGCVRFAICIANTDYPAALEVRKIYQVLPDADAAQHQYLRIIDESGEDYLYPAAYFVPIDLPQTIREALLKVA